MTILEKIFTTIGLPVKETKKPKADKLKSLNQNIFDPIVFSGTWDYKCIIDDNYHFPHEIGNAHGGTCKIEVNSQVHYSFCRITIHGKRTWNGFAKNGNVINKQEISPKDWTSFDGAVIDFNKFYYKYIISHEALDGITFAELKVDPKGKSFIKGNFYYVPDREGYEKYDEYEKIKSESEILKYLQIVGTVILTPQKD